MERTMAKKFTLTEPTGIVAQAADVELRITDNDGTSYAVTQVVALTSAELADLYHLLKSRFEG